MTTLGSGGGGIWVGGNEAGISPLGGGPDNAIARWDGTTAIQGSLVILTDAAGMEFDPGGYIRMGRAAGSGAASAASVGTMRYQSTCQWVARVPGDGANHSLMDLNGATLVWGNTYPTVYHDSGAGGQYSRVAGTTQMYLGGGLLWLPNWPIRVGLTPGSGAGSAAASGSIRETNTFSHRYRNVADTGDIPAISSPAGIDDLIIGDQVAGFYPLQINIISGGWINLQTGPSSLVSINLGAAYWNIPALFFEANQPTVALQQIDDTVAAAVGSPMLTAAQSCTGAGATIGGARLDRSGDSTNGTGGDYTNRPGGGPTAGGTYTIANGAATPNLLVDDTGTHNRWAWSLRRVAVDNASSPYAIASTAIVVWCLSSTGAITATLPSAASWPDRVICVKDGESNCAVNTITVGRTVGDTIDNVAADVTLRNNNEAKWFQSDGVSNWGRIAAFL